MEDRKRGTGHHPAGSAGRHDAVVVGAGPAGAVTALLLARSGLDVLLIDRRRFPRAKPCGDCLSAAATGLLAELGLLDAVLAAGASPVAGWCVIGPSGDRCEGRFEGAPALALERRALDAVLVRAAVDAGARLERGYVRDLHLPDRRAAVRGVVVRGPGGERVARARLVVGADGLRSVVARRLGLLKRRPRLRKVSLTTHGDLAGTALRTGEMHVLEGGCIGFAPAGASRFNLTLVVGADAAGRLRDVGPRRLLAEWLERAPSVRDRLRGATLETPLASGPFDWPVRSAAHRGVALVGDAAGYYDPFTGQGIHHGMAAARELAERAAPALRSGGLDAALGDYARAHRRLTRPARRLQRVIEMALAAPDRADAVLRRLAAAPAVMDRLVAVTGDLRPALSLLSPGLLLSLVIPPKPETA